MLRLGIPAYQLPREVLDREIAALLDDNTTLRMGGSLGDQITTDSLFDAGFDAVFLAFGSMKSLPLRVEGEQVRVHPSLRFLSEFSLRGVSLGHGKVGVVGGGNSAIDAAPIALRQEGVEQVTIIAVPHVLASERRASVVLRVATTAPSLATSTTTVAPSARSPEGTHSLPCASKDFAEVEQVVAEGIARREAGRCLRCDLDFDGDARSLGAPTS